MRYRLEIKEEARQQLRALPKEQRRNIGWRLDALQDDLAGDVKKLAARTQEYRLRIGNSGCSSCWKPTPSVSMLCEIAKKPVSKSAVQDQPTLESLAATVRELQERIEDLEDLNELRAAVERNAGKPGMPWEQAKADLGIE